MQRKPHPRRGRAGPPRRGRAGPARRGRRRPIDLELAGLVRRQHGVITRAQLLEAGLGAGAIAHRLRSGRLFAVHRGVYRFSPAPLSEWGEWKAATLAVPGSLLSHRSAAVAWGFARSRRGPVEVTVAARGRRSVAGVRVHRARRLHESDRAMRHGIPLTAAARTLLDLAELGDGVELRRAVDEADRLGLLHVGELEATIDRGRGRHGIAPLRALLADYLGAPRTRSELEDRFLDLCRAWSLPMPRTNAVVAGLEVDAYWPEARLVVELDGYAHHGRGRRAFERDHEREAILRGAGLDLLRFTWRQLERRAEQVRELVVRRVTPR